jgi:hypothetical protein
LASRLKSNEIALQIIPADSQWQGEQLARIRGVLDAIPPPRFGENEARQGAIRNLCDLGTEDAAREIARRLRLQEFCVMTFTLHCSLDRAALSFPRWLIIPEQARAAELRGADWLLRR